MTLTDAGREVLAAVFPGHIEIVRGLLFVALDDGDVHDLARIVGRVRDDLREQPATPQHLTPRSRARPAKVCAIWLKMEALAMY